MKIKQKQKSCKFFEEKNGNDEGRNKNVVKIVKTKNENYVGRNIDVEKNVKR